MNVENKSVDQIAVEHWVKANPEAKTTVDRTFEIPRLKNTIARWQDDLDKLNADLEDFVNVTADRVLFTSGNKNRVLAILAEYNKYLFDYANQADLIHINKVKDERALWELENNNE